MRILRLFLAILFLAASAAAQSSSAEVSPNVRKSNEPVEIIEKKWSMRLYIPMLDRDPASDNTYDRDEEIRVMRETLRQERIRSQTGLSLDSRQVDINEEEFKPKPNEPFAIYTYRTRIKNNSPKKIQRVEWDYIFLAPGTNKEVGRRRFANKIKITPGKDGKLEMQSPAPPTGSINAAKKPEKNSRVQYDEKILIQKIEYTDGSIWKAAP